MCVHIIGECICIILFAVAYQPSNFYRLIANYWGSMGDHRVGNGIIGQYNNCKTLIGAHLTMTWVLQLVPVTKDFID